MNRANILEEDCFDLRDLMEIHWVVWVRKVIDGKYSLISTVFTFVFTCTEISSHRWNLLENQLLLLPLPNILGVGWKFLNNQLIVIISSAKDSNSST